MIRFFGNSNDAASGNAANNNGKATGDNLITNTTYGQNAQSELIYRRGHGTSLVVPNPQPQPLNLHSNANNR